MKKYVLLSLLFLGTALFIACGDDEEPMTEECNDPSATYDGGIKDIIDNSCAYAGCHDGVGGIGPGDFTNYASISLFTFKFENVVIENADDPVLGMPPNMSEFPESMKDDLTAAELELFQCWIDQGFPEN